MTDAPLFSIITVCFNAIQVLQITANSLKNQTYCDYEWIVIDGLSTDGSVAWLKEIGPHIFLSEKDNGIYDAMNKAIDLSNGQYLFFLNAGDAFPDTQVLQDIALTLNSQKLVPDVIYGDVIYFGKQGTRRKRFHWLRRYKLKFGDLCHQAAFVRRDLFKTIGKFDQQYRYNADFDWFIRSFNSETNLCYVKRDIALFHDAGAHVLAEEKCTAERNIVRRKYCNYLIWLIGHYFLRIELKIRRLLGQEV